MTLSCNVNCSCSQASINPVCGEDNLSYLSPCHAGCRNFTSEQVRLKDLSLRSWPLFLCERAKERRSGEGIGVGNFTPEISPARSLGQKKPPATQAKMT